MSSTTRFRRAPSGLFVPVGAGRASLASGSRGLAVNGASGGGLGAINTNVPAGATLITDWNIDQLDRTPTPADWRAWTDPVTGVQWDFFMNRPGVACSIPDVLPFTLPDATAPYGTGRVLRVSYEGVPEGNEPKFPAFAIPAGLRNNRVFVACAFRIAPTWRSPGNGDSTFGQADWAGGAFPPLSDWFNGIKWWVVQGADGFKSYMDLSGGFGDAPSNFNAPLWGPEPVDYGTGRPTLQVDIPQTTSTLGDDRFRRTMYPADHVVGGPGPASYAGTPMPDMTTNRGVLHRARWYKLSAEYTIRVPGASPERSRIRVWLDGGAGDNLILDTDVIIPQGWRWNSTGQITGFEFGATRGGGSGWPDCATMQGQFFDLSRIACWTAP